MMEKKMTVVRRAFGATHTYVCEKCGAVKSLHLYSWGDVSTTISCPACDGTMLLIEEDA